MAYRASVGIAELFGYPKSPAICSCDGCHRHSQSSVGSLGVLVPLGSRPYRASCAVSEKSGNLCCPTTQQLTPWPEHTLRPFDTHHRRRSSSRLTSLVLGHISIRTSRSSSLRRIVHRPSTIGHRSRKRLNETLAGFVSSL